MNLLVIDLDGTITKSDNLLGFSYYMILKEKKIRFFLIFPLLLFLKIKLISNVKFKIWYSKLIFSFQRINYLNECAIKFSYSSYFHINKDILTFIDEQKDSTKIILSANYSFIAESIAKLIKIETCLAVNLATKNGKYTGQISGQIPYGKEKITVFLSFLNNKKYNKTIGIGDSKSDLPILKYIDEGYLISINKKTNSTTFSKV